MSEDPTPPRSSTGQEAQDALRAVLEEQVDRRQRQGEALRPKGPSAVRPVAAIVLALVSAWVWISPPGLLKPRPIPPPPPIVQESGLRIDVYMVAVQIMRFQSSTGRLPITVEEAVSDPIRADHFEYAAVGPDLFQLTAERNGHVVVYWSDESLVEFVSNAQAVLERVNP